MKYILFLRIGFYNRVGTQILNHLTGDFIKLGASYVNPFVYSDKCCPDVSNVYTSLHSVSVVQCFPSMHE